MRTCTEVIPRVTPEAAQKAIEETEQNRPVLTPGTPLGNLREHDRLAGVLLTGKKWATGRVLRVAFVGGDSSVVSRVKPYFLAWTQYANIGFEFVSDPALAEIRVAFVAGDGSWSYLGTDALTIPRRDPTMNFGWLTPEESETEYSRVVLHEVGHALGMPHEHQHPQGGIPWDKDAVYRYYSGRPNYWDKATIDANIFARYSESQTVFSEFDRKSIMLYAVPNELTVGDWSVGWNTQLSEQDKSFIEWQYPKPNAPTAPTVETISKTKFCATLVSTLATKNLTLTASGKPFGTFQGIEGG